LTAWLANKHSDIPIVVGINGAQGSGKSTLSKILKSLLTHGFGKSVVHLSIDDLYLSQQRRQKLANEIHPLLEVRGVPGTHDVELGKKILSALVNKKSKFPVVIPVFDKAQDDLLPKSEWLAVDASPDIILFEGWCVGSRAQKQSELKRDVNELEKSKDREGIWRNYVNDQLAGPYQDLFGFIDYQLMLKVPDMESVFEWRALQEKRLEEHCTQENILNANVMSESEIAQFIMHYERITRASLEEMPDRADILLELNKQHQVCNIKVGA
jgi:D-glycerate 3-kinase